MYINLVSCLFVLDSEKNDNIRKNDIKKIKVLTTCDNILPTIPFNGKDMKEEVRKELATILGSDIFHLEQVFTMDYKGGVDIIYLGITNIENVKNLKSNYQLLEFKVENNNRIMYGDSSYSYQTLEEVKNNSIQYIHDIKAEGDIQKLLLYLLISYKKIRANIDISDIIFKFMGSSFTLEDVRIVYEMVKNTVVDKSNFRKKIIKYCEKIDEKDDSKNGFRPSQKYRFKPLRGDVWL